MISPPTFVAEYEGSSWITATTPKTVAPDTTVGDHLLVLGADSNEANHLSTPTGNSLTYTLEESSEVAAHCPTYLWSAVDAAGGTGWTLSVTAPPAGTPWGFTVLRFADADGFGASNNNAGSGTSTLNITTVRDNSAIVVIVADWVPVDGVDRVWLPVEGLAPDVINEYERVYMFDSGDYTIYVAYYPDAGTAGLKTVGLSAPLGQEYAILALEIKGIVGSGTPEPVTGNTDVMFHKRGW